MGAKRRKKRGIKRKAVLSKIMERTAQNRVIFGANAKKEKSRNPHGYWIFRWRSGWDSNPRAREDYLISSQARYDHFDTAPYMFSRRFSPPFSGRKRLWKELTERTANYSVFRTGQNPHGYTVSAGRNGQLPTGFRVFYSEHTLADFEAKCPILRVNALVRKKVLSSPLRLLPTARNTRELSERTNRTAIKHNNRKSP